jgi:hypothetical protein
METDFMDGDERVTLWVEVIEALADNLGISRRRAAELIALEFRTAAERLYPEQRSAEARSSDQIDTT